MALRSQGKFLKAVRFLMKILLVMMTITLVMAIIWPRQLAREVPTDGHDMLSNDHEHIGGHPSFERRINEGLLSLYKQKLKDIAQFNLSGSTSAIPCEKESNMAKPCVDSKCTKSILKPSIRNFESLLQRQYNIPRKYLKVMNSLTNPALDETKISFLTAVSSNHYLEWLALLKSFVRNILPGISDFRLYVYDLGLTQQQAKEIQRHCSHCFVRPFPFKDLPAIFSNLKSYTWKPLLVKAHLSTSEYVFWMDASVRFVTKNLTSILARVRERGMLISPSSISTALHTDTRMYDYFGLAPCQMSRFRELEATFLIFHSNIFTDKAIVTPWLACAFSPNCMYPYKQLSSDIPRHNCRKVVRKYGFCHRFDQSALSAILAIIYGDQIGYVFLVKNSINVNDRGDTIKYFPANR